MVAVGDDDLLAWPPGALQRAGEEVGCTVGGGGRFADRAFVNAANTLAVPPYTLVDAVASYAVNSHLTLRVNAYNLTDETYIRSISNNGGRDMPGLTRSVLVSTQVGF